MSTQNSPVVTVVNSVKVTGEATLELIDCNSGRFKPTLKLSMSADGISKISSDCYSKTVQNSQVTSPEVESADQESEH